MKPKLERRCTVLGPMLLAALLLGSQVVRAEDTWVADLDLTKVRQGWGEPHKDQSVEGHLLSIGGQKFAHGLGTHSVGSLLLNLKGGSARFLASVGIDDEVGQKGSVEFKVYADGQQIWASGVLKGGAAPKPVDLDVKGVQTLALRVGDAGDGYEFDHADWAEARLEVTGEKPEAFVRPATDVVIAMRPPADAPTPAVTAAHQPATPPMGWNSYDGYGDSVTEAEMLDNARAVEQHLKAHGWQYVVVDYCWYDADAYNNSPNEHLGAKLPMDEYGRLLPAGNRFPSATAGRGFKPLAKAIHALGLKFGIHIMRGIPRVAVAANTPIEGSHFHAADAADTNDVCGWCPFMYGVRGNSAAGQAWYDALFRQYAAWGLDFVKVDDLTAPYHGDEVAAIHHAIAKCGRPIVFSTSPGETPIQQAQHVAANANMWRCTGDFWDNWGQLDAAFTFADRWTGHGRPNHWPDLDMLPLGHLSVKGPKVAGRAVGPDRQTKFTKGEQVTMLTLWCLAPSPLMLGGVIADADAWELALLSNDEVLALNQDTGGTQAKRVSAQNDLEVWRRDLADGSCAVALFNRSEEDATVRSEWSQLGLHGRFLVRDLWQRKDLTSAEGQLELAVPAHDAVLLRLRQAKP